MRSRRRTFILTYYRPGHSTVPATTTFLAADADYVRRWAERAGYRVVSVEPKPRAAKGSGRRFKIDQGALAEVIDFLGLKHPVYISIGQGRQTIGYCETCYGWQLPQAAPSALRDADVVHHVKLSGLQEPERASRTLWHELAHAMQGERYMDEAGPNVDHLTRMRRMREAFTAEHLFPYRLRPCEKEADNYEEFASEIAPCVAV